ncbi:DUF1254 domain-containing protein [Methylocystis parvus]|uniref:DUF1254 domain-containing protein n=1 Tax=Methylocystis parvus TaxID=134 RepID=A0A6B8MET8_9HYPH|nr:DUF1254 domain-containing protein [Methylocystis parvus]QGN00060.1 DUF1254 domain-containing protein [Methylocystis parvus]WBK02441.1 DUF1254 domain-containing protein [Methylocystis parvus OBBP]
MKKNVVSAACALMLLGAPSASAQQMVSADEAREIARETFVYAYPLILSEITFRVGKNVEAPIGTSAPLNQFGHMRAFPDPSFTIVVRPNADTLYSSLGYDVTKEPLVISVPAAGDRYYLLPFLDFWSDVFTVPGTRTTGNEAQTFAITGPNWKGKLPAGVKQYRSPTGMGLLIGRAQTNGKADYAAVRMFQDGIKAAPLSAYGKPYTPPKGKVDPKQDMSAPPDQIDRMDASRFFSMFAELMKTNPPHANDNPILDRMKRIGIEPGKSFKLTSAPKEVQDALNSAPTVALPQIKEAWRKAGVLANGWRTNMTAIGTYGTDYLHRAGVAYGGYGANAIEDALYPTAFADANGQPFSSDRRYVLHFAKDQIPPVRGFWSLTMYDERQLFTANAIDRYAIGDRDKLAFNADGSLDLYIQRESPGKEKESNWLPAPESGSFTMNLRLYWPKAEVLNGSWAPPPVKRVN